MASENPTMVARRASRLSVSVSTATTPASRASATQRAKVASSVTQSYPPKGAATLPSSCAGVASLVETKAAGRRSGPASPKPIRARMERNPCVRKNASSLPSPGALASSAAISSGKGALSSNSTSRREIRANSAFCISASRRFGCLISAARASSDSRSPYSLINCAAVLMPMPGTPGTLSVASPASACTSTTLSGVTPNFSITSGARSGFCFMGSSICTAGRINCIRSLSEETIVT